MTHKAQGFTLDDYPNVKRWYADVRARPQVQAGLAIGKFVKEPFNEETRRVMFGQMAKDVLGKGEVSRSAVMPGRREARAPDPFGPSATCEMDSGLALRAPRNDEISNNRHPRKHP